MVEIIFKSESSKDAKAPKSKETDTSIEKNHPWRMCPIGEHWVSSHSLTVPASEKGGEYQTIRAGHCRKNPSGAEFYTFDELKEIVKSHFKEIQDDKNVMPVPDSLGFPNGNVYDLLIGGWTKFWNDILQPKAPLSPDFVKVLIATESSFKLPLDQKSNDGSARGLIQITENTRKILQDPKGELKNHLIKMTIEESRDPEVNIAAGIRWLHHKKRLAESRLKREVSWEEAGAEYKGILPDLGKDRRSDRIMSELTGLHKKLKEQRK